MAKVTAEALEAGGTDKSRCVRDGLLTWGTSDLGHSMRAAQVKAAPGLLPRATAAVVKDGVARGGSSLGRDVVWGVEIGCSTIAGRATRMHDAASRLEAAEAVVVEEPLTVVLSCTRSARPGQRRSWSISLPRQGSGRGG
jgi:hypothetical protein